MFNSYVKLPEGNPPFDHGTFFPSPQKMPKSVTHSETFRMGSFDDIPRYLPTIFPICVPYFFVPMTGGCDISQVKHMGAKHPGAQRCGEKLGI